MKMIAVLALATLFTIPAVAAERSNTKSFFQGFAAQSRINQARKASPYRKYAKTYKELYKSGKISKADYTDKMLEVQRLETQYQQGITDRVRGAVNERRRSNQTQNLIDATEVQAPEPFIINGRSRVTDQFGNPVGYVEEPN